MIASSGRAGRFPSSVDCSTTTAVRSPTRPLRTSCCTGTFTPYFGDDTLVPAESVLRQDLTVVEDGGDIVQGLVNMLRANRGDLRLSEVDFRGWSRGARFYPMLYMMTRVAGSRDWESGNPLTAFLLGHLATLQVHHIFPKAFLYDHDFDRRDVNALANFTFLTQNANLKISDRKPVEYFPEVESRHPGVLAHPLDTNGRAALARRELHRFPRGKT